MALFQFRKGRDEQPAPPKPAQSVEALRRRAIHRLIGAAILVVAGVIGFPMLFDNQPRPIAVDLPIVIPDKAKAAGLAVPPALPKAAVTVTPEASVAAAPATPVAVAAPPVAAATLPAVPPAPVAAPAVAAPTTPAQPVAAVPPATPTTPVVKPGDAAKAQALLDGKDATASAGADDGSRFVVQVGAFADAAKAREVRQKVEGSGLKTYTQVVETKDGSRTRVRVGPFADKAEATRVADKIRKLDLPAAILAL